MSQTDTPLHVSQKPGGCESVQMVRKYTHLSGTHLAEYKDRVRA